MLQRVVFILIIFICPALVNATALPSQNWIVQARQRHLSTSVEWMNLVHYRPNLIGHGYTSFTDDRDFFLATDGKTNPEAELEATLNAIALPLNDSDPDKHAQCRFIARYHWLKQSLSIPDAQLPQVTCHTFLKWYQTINPAHVTLVFPSAYINNPSSMFGHTMLRIDPKDNAGKTALTSYSISYAAETTEFNGLIFAIKGLTGGYAGYFSIQPYYDKVNEYSDLENRDIWEYDLNFTPAEVKRLMQHAWELHNTAFDYYFLDENCSFQLLSLLDVARPGMNLTADFPLGVIPVDTVRDVIKQKNILGGVKYRPSSRTNLTFWLNQLPKQQQDWILEYCSSESTLSDPRLTTLPSRERAHLLDVTYEYVQYQYRRRILTRDISAAKSLQLLTLRSQISDTQALPSAPQPAVRPDQGHLSSRFMVGYGSFAKNDFTQITWRPAYHDLLDNDQGHVAGSQINFLNTSIRKYSAQDKIQLENLTVIDIFSITPTNRFFKSLSWHFDTGFERLAIDKDSNALLLAYTINGGAGYTLALSSGFRVYGMLDASAIIQHEYTNYLAAGPGVRVGALWQISSNWKLLLEARALDISYHDDRVLQYLDIGQNYSLNRNNALRLTWSRSGEKDNLSTQALLSWIHYF